MSAPSQYLTVSFDLNTALSLHRWHPTPPLTALAFPVLFFQGQCAYYTPSHLGRSRSMHLPEPVGSQSCLRVINVTLKCLVCS